MHIPGKLQTLYTETESDILKNVLPFWMDKVTDPAGGFYGAVDNCGRPLPGEPKGSILNARIIWTFSRAYRLYGNEAYRTSADRAAEYFTAHLIDNTYGGAVWTVDTDGNILDGTKQSYATAFGIYGLAEHFRATGSKASLDAAIGLFRSLEDHAHDNTRKGYFEVFNRDWSKTDIDGVDGMGGATKTMNTHIHIMEAYTNLYAAWPDKELRERLFELVEILRTRLYDHHAQHLVLWCDDSWNSLGDVQSYGHDIETSWLLTETAEILGNETLLANVRLQAVAMTDEAIAHGLRPDGAMLYEKTPAGVREDVSWWCQCETVVGCVNAWQITGDEKYLDTALRNWECIKAHFIDRVNGCWFTVLTRDFVPCDGTKASLWNCPYHNSRMAFELKTRLENL